jgi:hypothetical protein
VTSDARFCSHRCQRRIDPAMEQIPVAGELADGWRQVGRYVIPPADPRLTFRVD